MILYYVLCVATVAYMVRVLLFDGSNGPFESKTHVVVDNGTNEGLVNLWDRVRRVFGVYQLKDAGDVVEWHTTVRADVWRCPKCLSFWMTFLVSVPFTLFLCDTLWVFPIVHGSMTFFAQFSVFVQLALEE